MGLQGRYGMHMKPPFVTNTNNITEDDIVLICKQLSLSSHEMDCLWRTYRAVISANDRISMVELAIKEGISLNGVRKRMNLLVDKGAMEKSSERIEGVRRPISVFVFKAAVISAPIEKKQKEIFIQRFEGGSTSGSMVIDNSSRTMVRSPAIDDLICSVLFSALDFNRKGKSTEIRVVIDWYGFKVPVITRSVHGSVIARVTDLRVYIAILTLCEQIVKNKIRFQEDVVNLFSIELSDILDVMKREKDGGNRDSVIKSMSRLSTTSFVVSELPSKILERFCLSNMMQTINPLSDFGIYEKPDRKIYKDTFISFQLPHVVYDGMISERRSIFKIRPDALKENNEVFFAFHLWCRRRIGKKAIQFITSIERLNEEIAPGVSSRDFKRRFYSGLERFETIGEEKDILNNKVTWSNEKIKTNRVVTSCFVSVYGYAIKIKNKKITISASFDKNMISMNDESSKIMSLQDNSASPISQLFY